MSINVADGQYATIWSVEAKDKYSVVRLGTSRKDKRDNTYKNSNWSFVRFVGAAHTKLGEIANPERTRIQLKGATLDLEPYTDSTGAVQYPKSVHFTVFNFELAEAREPSVMDTPPATEDDEDELPF